MDKIKPEDLQTMDRIIPSRAELESVGDTYRKYYDWRSYRSGMYLQFRGYNFDDYLTVSRELFWNSINTKSDDLKGLGLEFAIPFARKEALDFLSKLTSLNVKPHIVGDNVDAVGIKILQGMYKKWAFRSNSKVETFWELLYGIVNGTVASYVGYDNSELKRRYLRNYDPTSGKYNIEEKTEKKCNDVTKEIVPIEDMYIPKISERNFQKQGRCIWKTQMSQEDFKLEFGKYPMSKYVFPGSRIAEDSLYFQLLGGTGTTTSDKIEVIRDYDWFTDSYKIVASGILLNPLGKGEKFETMPMPFDHKMGPFTWGPLAPLDTKLAYGLSIPFQSKDPHKILNVSYTMMVERELRAVDPAILSSDIETPEFIFGQHKVVQVNDVNAYKEMQLSEPSNQYFSMLNSLQSQMTANTQGGDAKIIPSRQPDSARAVMQDSLEKQQAISNTMILYYDLIRQQVLLVLKTALQFYTADKYQMTDKNTIRTLMVSDMPLAKGGIGNVKIEIVKEKKMNEMEIFLAAIKESIVNGKQTEIIQVPVSFLQDLEFYIEKIELEPDKSTELELATFVENVINPMLTTYVPAGQADISKVMLRHLEKMGESPSDFVADQNVANMITNQPADQSMGQTNGNLMNSMNGMTNGMNQNGSLTPKFGSPEAKPLPINK